MNIMASTSETGHVKNVANFENLITTVKSYGESYKPIKTVLTIPELEKKKTEAQTTIDEVLAAKAKYDTFINGRRMAFEGIKPLATRVVSAFSVSGADNLAVNNIKSANKKLQGQRSSSTKQEVSAQNVDAVKPTNVSTSQQSYDNQTAHFAGIIEVLKQYPSFVPNETELTVQALENKLAELKKTNSDIISPYTEYTNALTRRNHSLYDPMTGLVQIAKEVKQYVKSLFGASSPQYKQITTIEFKGRA